MAQLTQRGLIDSIGAIETRQYNDKTFVSRTLTIEQPRFDQYSGEKLGSNFIKFEATKQDICDALNNFQVGNKVDVEFILRGSKYDKKDGSGKDVFTKLEIRSISLAGNAPQQSAPQGASPIPTAQPAPAPAPQSPVSDYDPDLGF